MLFPADMTSIRSPPSWAFHNAFSSGLYGHNLSPTNTADAYAVLHAGMPNSYQHGSLQQTQPGSIKNEQIQAPGYHDPRSGNFPQIVSVSSARSTPTTAAEVPTSLQASHHVNGNTANVGNGSNMGHNGMIISSTPPAYNANNPFIAGNTSGYMMSLSPTGLNLPAFRGTPYGNQNEGPRAQSESSTPTSVPSYGYYRGPGTYETVNMSMGTGFGGVPVKDSHYADVHLANHTNGHGGEELDENGNRSAPKGVWRPY